MRAARSLLSIHRIGAAVEKIDHPATPTAKFRHTGSPPLTRPSLPRLLIIAAATAVTAGMLSGCNQCSRPGGAAKQPAPGQAPGDAAGGSGSDALTALSVTEPQTGTGALAADDKPVSILYKGMFLDGRVFDQRTDKAHPLTFRLGAHEVIAGLDAGIRGMRVGSRRRIVIPADLAYGAQGFGAVIPPHTPLVFEVELIKAE